VDVAIVTVPGETTGPCPALVEVVTLSSSWSKRTTWKRMKIGLPTQRVLGRALFSLQLVDVVTLSSSWSKRTTWKRMKMGLPTQRALGRALFSLQLVEG
jgi:hypothetical protein